MYHSTLKWREKTKQIKLYLKKGEKVRFASTGMHMELTRDQAQNTYDWGLHINRDKDKKKKKRCRNSTRPPSGPSKNIIVPIVCLQLRTSDKIRFCNLTITCCVIRLAIHILNWIVSLLAVKLGLTHLPNNNMSIKHYKCPEEHFISPIKIWLSVEGN